MFLLKDNTQKINREHLIGTADSIADDLSSLIDPNAMRGRGAMGGLGAYLRFIDNVAIDEVWVMDQQGQLLSTRQHHQMHQQAPQQKEMDFTGMPKGTKEIIEIAYAGKKAVLEDDSKSLRYNTVVANPIYDSNDHLSGVVMLFSSVNKDQQVVTEGAKVLVISIGAALILAFLLSLWLSKTFTQPIVNKEAMDALKMEEVRKEFVANISHELKTPITVIRGSLEALKDGVVPEDEIESYQQQLLDETIYLQRLVGDLMDLSSLQSPEFITEKEDVVIQRVISDSLRSLRHLIDDKKIKVTQTGLGGSYHLSGDYGRLRQMLLIILDNAIKFSPQGGNIEIKLEDNRLSIADQGKGIPKEDLTYIFERFYRVEDETQGTGLGLPIAKQIAQRHGINLSVSSVLGKGTAFYMDLP